MAAPVPISAPSAPRFAYFLIRLGDGKSKWSKLHRTADGKRTPCGVKLRQDQSGPLSQDFYGLRITKREPKGHRLEKCAECAAAVTV